MGRRNRSSLASSCIPNYLQPFNYAIDLSHLRLLCHHCSTLYIAAAQSKNFSLLKGGNLADTSCLLQRSFGEFEDTSIGGIFHPPGIHLVHFLSSFQGTMYWDYLAQRTIWTAIPVLYLAASDWLEWIW